MRYLRVGGTRECHFAGTSFKPRNLPENAETPTRRVHEVLGIYTEREPCADRSHYYHPDKIIAYLPTFRNYQKT